MEGQHILVVDDEPAIRVMLRRTLERAGFRASAAEDAQAARLVIADDRPQLMLLDWMLPGVSGIELARELRRDELTAGLPIIMLTAKAEKSERVRGLDWGCDDYITKPFSSTELVARTRAVLRRTLPGGESERLSVDGLSLDGASQRVTSGGEAVAVSPTEFRLLAFFMGHPERVYTREQLLNRVWGHNVYVEERTVDAHIRRLRKALSRYGHAGLIQTVRGSGYRFSRQT